MALSNEQLSRLLLFHEVDPESIRTWVDRCPLREFPAGFVLLSPNVENELMYVIVSGRVSIRLSSIENNPIAYAREGESIGEMSIFDGAVRPSAFVKAETDLTVLLINRESLMELIEHSHGVAKNMLYLLSSRVRSGNAAVTKSQYLQKEFEQHANVDALTGLYNRRWINNYFDRFMGRLGEQDKLPCLSIIMIDVDFFKHFNDEHGHLAGDHVLRVVAATMRDSVRPTDIVSRYGGEEFLVILPGTTAENAHDVAERIRCSIKDKKISMKETDYPSITISAGLATLQADDTFETLVEAADKGLYQAKQKGRNQIACIR